MLAEFGTLSLEQVLEPAMQMAAGYPMEQTQTANIEASKELLASLGLGAAHHAAEPRLEAAAGMVGAVAGPDLRAAGAARDADEARRDRARRRSKAGKSRKQAILAAYDRFYRGDIAREIVAETQAAGGLITMEDLDRWQVYVEDPAVTNYKGIDVYKLNHWVQGPVMLQTLNLLENADLRGMGYNSARYIHTIYQAMNLAFADRDFYYGDPYVPPVEPIKGLLSKEYARKRFAEIDWEQNDAFVRPGDPYPFQGATNPYRGLLDDWRPRIAERRRVRCERRRAHAHARRGVPRRHDVAAGGRCRGLGRVDHAERRLGAGVHSGQHRRRLVAAHAELRARSRAQSVQRARAGQAAARHA